MSTRIITLFGEEILPEPQKPAGKGRGKKSEITANADDATEEQPEKDNVAEQPAANAATATEPEPANAVAERDAEPAVEATPEAEEVPALTEIAEQPITDAATANPEANDTAGEMAPAPAKKSRKRQGDDGLMAKPDTDIIPEDWRGEKKYYTIGEVAGFFKVNTSHIRFWTNEFKLKVRTTRKGDRLFSPDQVKELRAIYHLVKERGFTLSGARTKLKEQNKRDVTTVDLKTSLQDLRSRLVKLRDQLT